MFTRSARLVWVRTFVASAVLACCSAPAQQDAGRDSAEDGATDAAPCRTDMDCNDRVFCNGAERCMPGAAGADRRGCVAANSPCLATETCDEAAAQCRGACGVTDADGDGHRSIACGGDDCDDHDANRFPGNREVCALTTGTAGDGGAMSMRIDPTHDEDCDPSTLSDFATRDGDHDNDQYVDIACCNVDTAGSMHCGTDCDDLRARVGFPDAAMPYTVAPGDIHPMEPEVCNGVDDNCNGVVDEGMSFTFYRDCDGDGFGDQTDSGSVACTPMQLTACGVHPPVTNHSDCDDMRADVHPGAAVTCDGTNTDYACTGMPPAGCSCTSGSSIPCGSTLPGCAMGMQTCIGGSYSACSVTTVPITCYVDSDSDTFAPMGAATMMACVCPDHYTARAPGTASTSDCDDTRATVNPGQPESCDGVDNNCNAMIDEGLPRFSFYPDCDGDGFGSLTGAATLACGVGAVMNCNGHVAVFDHADCNDANTMINPAASEVCNGLDDNCNSLSDEGLPVAVYYPDCDGDSFGSATATGSAAVCGPPVLPQCSGHPEVLSHTDCNDTDAMIRPTATEVCNGVDDDCDGTIDDGLMFYDFYPDTDRDGFGATTGAMHTCNPTVPAGYTADHTDCCDTDRNAHPGETTLYSTPRSGCGGYDYNCDGVANGESNTGFQNCYTNNSTMTCSWIGGFGWVGSVPACGATGQWTSLMCSAYPSCTPAPSLSRTRRCQ